MRPMIIENPAYVFYRRIKRIRFDPGQSLSAAQAIARGLRIGVFAGRRLRSRRGVSSRPAGGRSGRFPFAVEVGSLSGAARREGYPDYGRYGRNCGRPYFGQTRRAGDGAGHVAEPFRTQSFGDYRGYAAQWKPQQLSDEEIDYYVDRYRPYDKAGAYGIQEWIGYVAIERIEGSFYNVMGLPVQKLLTELEIFIELKEK